jgi:nucleoside-diphosphate-sugar epimerase
MNTYLPAQVCRKYRDSRILAFSSGNVYGYVGPQTGGSREDDPPRPVGEYAMSVLGRERIFEYFSRQQGTAVTLLRLNYACELRYGVLVDLARQIASRTPVDVTMSHVNVIWQGDANAMALAALGDARCPPYLLNVAGSETLSVRDLSRRLGELLQEAPIWSGNEASDALLSNANLAHERYGAQRVDAEQMLVWIADWIRRGGPTWNKPTHFQSRDGGF